MNPRIRFLIAAHESAHCLAARELGVLTTSMSIDQTPGTLGVCCLAGTGGLSALQSAVVDAAGDAAVAEVGPDAPRELQQWINRHVGRQPPQTPERIFLATARSDRFRISLLDDNAQAHAHHEAQTIIRRQWPTVIVLARALAKHGRLDRDQIEQVIGDARALNGRLALATPATHSDDPAIGRHPATPTAGSATDTGRRVSGDSENYERYLEAGNPLWGSTRRARRE